MTRLGGQVPTFDVGARGQSRETTGAPAGTTVVPAREGDAAIRRGRFGISASRMGPVPMMPESSVTAERRAGLQSLLDDTLQSRQQIQENLEASCRSADERCTALMATQARLETEVAMMPEKIRTLRASATSGMTAQV